MDAWNVDHPPTEDEIAKALSKMNGKANDRIRQAERFLRNPLAIVRRREGACPRCASKNLACINRNGVACYECAVISKVNGCPLVSDASRENARKGKETRKRRAEERRAAEQSRQGATDVTQLAGVVIGDIAVHKTPVTASPTLSATARRPRVGSHAFGDAETANSPSAASGIPSEPLLTRNSGSLQGVGFPSADPTMQEDIKGNVWENVRPSAQAQVSGGSPAAEVVAKSVPVRGCSSTDQAEEGFGTSTGNHHSGSETMRGGSHMSVSSPGSATSGHTAILEATPRNEGMVSISLARDDALPSLSPSQTTGGSEQFGNEGAVDGQSERSVRQAGLSSPDDGSGWAEEMEVDEGDGGLSSSIDYDMDSINGDWLDEAAEGHDQALVLNGILPVDLIGLGEGPSLYSLVNGFGSGLGGKETVIGGGLAPARQTPTHAFGAEESQSIHERGYTSRPLLSALGSQASGPTLAMDALISKPLAAGSSAACISAAPVYGVEVAPSGSERNDSDGADSGAAGDLIVPRALHSEAVQNAATQNPSIHIRSNVGPSRKVISAQLHSLHAHARVVTEKMKDSNAQLLDISRSQRKSQFKAAAHYDRKNDARAVDWLRGACREIEEELRIEQSRQEALLEHKKGIEAMINAIERNGD